MVIELTNMELLEKLTLGKDNIETVTIEADGEEVEVQLRPLTSGELSKLQSLEKKGFVMKVGVNSKGKRESVSMTDVDVNAGEFNEYQTEAMYKAIAWSMSVEDLKVTEDNVKEFLPGIPEQIFEHIARISHIDDNDLTIIKTFRKK